MPSGLCMALPPCPAKSYLCKTVCVARRAAPNAADVTCERASSKPRPLNSVGRNHQSSRIDFLAQTRKPGLELESTCPRPTNSTCSKQGALRLGAGIQAKGVECPITMPQGRAPAALPLQLPAVACRPSAPPPVGQQVGLLSQQPRSLGHLQLLPYCSCLPTQLIVHA